MNRLPQPRALRDAAHAFGGARRRDAHVRRLRRDAGAGKFRLPRPDAAVDTPASPAKWHLAHTSWFFETFVLAGLAGHVPFNANYAYLFNSLLPPRGTRVARGCRAIGGRCSRPTLRRIRRRRYVDETLGEALALGRLSRAQQALVELGLQPEQQHQELLLTDIKHAFFQKPRASALSVSAQRQPLLGATEPLRWVPFEEEQLVAVGASGLAFLRQRASAPPHLHPRLRARHAAGHQRRISRLHRGRRLPTPRFGSPTAGSG